MSRISTILTRVRDTLADPDGDRWSDDRLIRLIDEAQKDICRRSKVLRDRRKVQVNIDGSVILPDDLLLLDTVLYKGKVLPLKSFLDFDIRVPNWDSDAGSPTCIIYDKQKRHLVRVYPKPYIETTVTLDSNNMLGVYTGDTNNIFGVSSMYTDNVFGVLTGAQPQKNVDDLVVYYIRKPKTITSIESILEIDDVLDDAIKYYVTGKALRDDMDTQNRVVGNEELKFYARELEEVLKDDEYDFTRNNTQYNTPYIGAFN